MCLSPGLDGPLVRPDRSFVVGRLSPPPCPDMAVIGDQEDLLAAGGISVRPPRGVEHFLARLPAASARGGRGGRVGVVSEQSGDIQNVVAWLWRSGRLRTQRGTRSILDVDLLYACRSCSLSDPICDGDSLEDVLLAHPVTTHAEMVGRAGTCSGGPACMQQAPVLVRPGLRLAGVCMIAYSLDPPLLGLAPPSLQLLQPGLQVLHTCHHGLHITSLSSPPQSWPVSGCPDSVVG